MITRPNRTAALRAAATAGVAVLALAGCTDSTESADATSSSSSAQASQSDGSGSSGAETSKEQTAGGGSFDKTQAQQVMLTEAEVGDGYTAVPEAQITASLGETDALADAFQQMQVEPAQCQAALQTMMTQVSDIADNLDQVAMSLFVKQAGASASTVTESIGPKSVVGSADDFKAQIGACGEMTLTMQGMSATASMQPISLDLGDETIALLTTVTVDAAGQKITQTSAAAYVTSGDAVLSVSLSGEGADPATLEALTTKAYEKAQPVLG